MELSDREREKLQRDARALGRAAKRITGTGDARLAAHLAQLAVHAARAAREGRWEVLCKRTNDPKLAWLEAQLQTMGIPSRRNGESWHAPILEVPAEHLDRAWKFLGSKLGRMRRTVDDIPDDDPMFTKGGKR